MSQVPAISLIILNFNGRQHLQACLSSVLALDYPKDRLEIILCDNGSSDDSVAYVRRAFPTVGVVALDRNYGFAEGNNRAAAQARHHWIGFLNNDMWVERDWLRQLVAPLASQPGLACLSSRILNWYGTTIDFIGAGMNFEGHGFQIDVGRKRSRADTARRVLSPCGGAMLIRSQLFTELGGFDADYFAFFEDADLGWRLNLLGHDVWYTPAATVYHRLHGTHKQFEAHRLRVLYERNALFTIYKCLEPANLAVALPAAMLLLNERALGYTEIDAQSFQLDGSKALPSGLPASPPAQVDGKPGLLERSRRVLREEGVRPLITKGRSFLGQRISRNAMRMRQRAVHNALLVAPIAISGHVALSDFGHALASLSAKRRWLQERRVRTDADLFPLFVDPLHASWDNPEYVGFQQHLVKVLGIDRRFCPPATRA
ncbi:MAG: glycosyltransferase family 2 protein [Candidatus Dormibacter sp.]